MQIKLKNYPRAVAQSTSSGYISWAGNLSASNATQLGGAKLFMAVNRDMTTGTPGSFNQEDNRYILVYDSLGTTLKQIIAVPPRNSLVMMKAPTDRISISNAHPVIQNPSQASNPNPSIGGESTDAEMITVTPLGFSDHPIVYQNPGDWKHTIQNGFSGGTMATVGACQAGVANFIGNATLVHAANFENTKACIQLIDANNVNVGSLQLPRGGHIKFRKRATDKVYASETISGGGSFDACRVIFEKIGYTN